MTERRTVHFRKFNPGLLQSDNDVTGQFVVRHPELDTVLQVLRDNIESPSCQHVLIIAPRGRGKTMMLARVSAELRMDSDLANSLLPVQFMEESHEVLSPADFWLEALFYLSLEIATSNPELSKELREAHADLKSRWRERDLVDRVRATILEAADMLDKQLVLMVENLQDISGATDDDFDWCLRHMLQSESRIMLLATATSRFGALVDARQAFFELFRTICLEPLDTESCKRLWHALSGNERSEQQIRPVQILTGGNPRLIVIVAQFAGHRSLRQLMNELVMLVDDHTEYFRSHLEGLAKTERRVYLAVIDLWQPSRTSEIAERAAMDVRTVSTMLGRLVNRGAISVEGEGRKRRYTATERLYCIYYKLRRERDEAAVVANLIRFMSAFYSEDEFMTMSRSLNDEASKSLAIRKGIERAVAEEPKLSGILSGKVRSRDELKPGQAGAADEAGARRVFVEAVTAFEDGRFHRTIEILDSFANPRHSDFLPAQESVICGALLLKARAYLELDMRDAEIATCDEVVERFGGSSAPDVQGQVAKALVCKGIAQGQAGEPEREIATYDEVVERFGDSSAPDVQELVARALVWKGITQGQAGEPERAVATCDEVVERFGGSGAPDVQERVARALLLRGWKEIEIGRTNAALDTCDELDKRLASQVFDEVEAFRLHAKSVRIHSLLSCRDLTSAKDTFGSAYSMLDLDNDAAVNLVLKLVIDLAAGGVSEQELVGMLVEDSTKSARLAPLVIALRRRVGEVVNAPVEVLEVAGDIDRRIDEEKVH